MKGREWKGMYNCMQVPKGCRVGSGVAGDDRV